MGQRSDVDLSQEGDYLEPSEEEVLAPRSVPMDSMSDATPDPPRRAAAKPAGRRQLSTWVFVGTGMTLLFLGGVAVLGVAGVLLIWGLSP